MTNTKGVKWSHIIPKFLIKRFRIKTEKQNLVLLYSTGWEKPKKAGARSVFVKENYYALPDGDNSFFEKQFCEIETKVGYVLSKVLENGPIDDHRKLLFLDFMYNILVRGYIFKVAAKGYAKRDQKQLEAIRKKLNELSGLNSNQKARIMDFPDKHNVTNAFLQHLPIIESQYIKNGKLIKDFELQIVPASNHGFILGDTGVIWFEKSGDTTDFMQFFDASNLKFLFLPLSPEQGLIAHPTNCKAGLPTTDEINERIALTSFHSFISSKPTENPKLHKKIGKGNHFPPAESIRDILIELAVPEMAGFYCDYDEYCKPDVELTFLNDCSLSSQDRDFLLKLARSFEQHAKSLSYADSLQLECTFTDVVLEAKKQIENSFICAVAQDVSVNSDMSWMNEVNTRMKSRYSNHFIINTAGSNETELRKRVDLLFSFYFELFFKAYVTCYTIIKKPYPTTHGYEYIKQTLMKVQIIKNATSHSYTWLQKNADKTKCDLVLRKLKDCVLFYFDQLPNSPFSYFYEFNKNNDLLFEEATIFSEELSSCICVSLAGYFAVSTPEQRDEFFLELKRKNSFRLIIEDEWKKIAELCDKDTPIAMNELALCLDRIQGRCFAWLWVTR